MSADHPVQVFLVPAVGGGQGQAQGRGLRGPENHHWQEDAAALHQAIPKHWRKGRGSMLILSSFMRPFKNMFLKGGWLCQVRNNAF